MLTACKVRIEGSESTFAAFHNPNRTWNGWEMPYLTKSEALRFVADSNANAILNNVPPDARYDAETDNFVFTSFDGIEEWVAPVTIDGRTLYDFATIGWCWDTVEDEDPIQ